MSTVFEMIIDGSIPGRFVWADNHCVVIATIQPVAPGHMLVIPRSPIDKWNDVPTELLAHLMTVAQNIADAQEIAFEVPRTTMVIAGFEVPHTHLHIIPAQSEAQALLSNAVDASPQELDAAATKLRMVLSEQGFGANVPLQLGSPALA